MVYLKLPQLKEEELGSAFKPLVAVKLFLVVLMLAALIVTAFAGGRGGASTTFEPNRFGGAANVSCITAAVAGTCATGYNATCNGVADDSTPLKNWLAASLAANPTLAVLYWPPGSRCHFATVNNFVVDTSIAGSGGFQYGDGIRNAVIWAYGATSDAWGVVGEGFGQNTLTTARIATVSAASTTVTLLVAGDASKFSVGDWIAVTGIQIQNGGFPPNFQFFEFHLITAINGLTLTLDSPTTYAYKSTWPFYDQGGTATIGITGAANNGSGLCRVTVASDATFTTGDKRSVDSIAGATGCNGNWTITKVGDGTHLDFQGTTFGGSYTSGGAIRSTDYGGPGTIYKMGPSWNTNIKVYGLGFRPTTEGAEVPLTGRTIALYDNSWGQSVASASGSGPAPTINNSILFSGSSLSTFHTSAGMEVDKAITSLTILNTTGNLFFQSASPATLVVNGFRGNVSGTPLDATFSNSTFPAVASGSALAIGSNCYGHGRTLVLDGATIASGSSVNCFVSKTLTGLSYSSGTFSISNALALGTTLTWAVPGAKYFFGYAFGSTVCNAGVTFTITDITQDATNTNFVTDLVGTLPTPACDAGSGSTTYDRYVAYPAATITQRNSTGTNMTVFAPP